LDPIKGGEVQTTGVISPGEIRTKNHGKRKNTEKGQVRKLIKVLLKDTSAEKGKNRGNLKYGTTRFGEWTIKLGEKNNLTIPQSPEIRIRRN